MILRWPAQATEAGLFAACGVPCLLMVEGESGPPDVVEMLLDWIQRPIRGAMGPMPVGRSPGGGANSG